MSPPAQRYSIARLLPSRPAELLERLPECGDLGLRLRVALRVGDQNAESTQSRALLRVRRQRPSRRAAEERDEFSPPHSMTSSASASSVGGIAMPSALAVLRLITSSYFVGCCTGKSAGFSPLRMRST